MSSKFMFINFTFGGEEGRDLSESEFELDGEVCESVRSGGDPGSSTTMLLISCTEGSEEGEVRDRADNGAIMATWFRSFSVASF